MASHRTPPAVAAAVPPARAQIREDYRKTWKDTLDATLPRVAARAGARAYAATDGSPAPIGGVPFCLSRDWLGMETLYFYPRGLEPIRGKLRPFGGP